MSMTLTMSKKYILEILDRVWRLDIEYKPKYEAIKTRLQTTKAYTLWIFPTTQFNKAWSDWSYWWHGAADKGYISKDEYEFIKAYKGLSCQGLREVLRDSISEDKVQVSVDTAGNINTLDRNCSNVCYYGVMI